MFFCMLGGLYCNLFANNITVGFYLGSIVSFINVYIAKPAISFNCYEIFSSEYNYKKIIIRQT